MRARDNFIDTVKAVDAAIRRTPEVQNGSDPTVFLKDNLKRMGEKGVDSMKPEDVILKVVSQLSSCGVSLPDNAKLSDIGAAQTRAQTKQHEGQCR